MKLLKIGLIFISSIFFIPACNETPKTTSGDGAIINNSTNTNNVPDIQPGATANETASAKNIYMEKCVKCHKEDGTGGKIEIEGEVIKAANLTAARVKKDKDEELIDQIKEGGDGMPAYKNKLTDEQIKDLVKFIKTNL